MASEEQEAVEVSSDEGGDGATGGSSRPSLKRKGGRTAARITSYFKKVPNTYNASQKR